MPEPKPGAAIIPKVEFFFDCGSPWSYIAFENIHRMRNELEFDLILRPILVGGVFDAANGSVYESRSRPVPAKDAYAIKDIKDWARLAGLVVNFPPAVFPVKSVRAMRACIVVGQSGNMSVLARAFFAAYWTEGLDISSPEIVCAICDRLGFDGQSMLEQTDAPQVKQALRDNTDELVARGGFGSPTIFIEENDMYFGNDRLVLVRGAVERLSRQAR